MNEYGHRKETKIATLLVKRKKVYSKLPRLSTGKARRSNKGNFPPLYVNVRKGICEVGWGL